MKQVYKQHELTINISPQSRNNIITNTTFFSMDVEAGKKIINFTHENEPVDLTNATVMLGFEFVGIGSSKIIDSKDGSVVIEDSKAGQCSIILPNHLYKYEGQVLVHVYITFVDGRSLDCGVILTEFEDSWLDSEREEMSDFYIKRFEDLAGEIKRRADEMQEILNEVDQALVTSGIGKATLPKGMLNSRTLTADDYSIVVNAEKIVIELNEPLGENDKVLANIEIPVTYRVPDHWVWETNVVTVNFGGQITLASLGTCFEIINNNQDPSSAYLGILPATSTMATIDEHSITLDLDFKWLLNDQWFGFPTENISYDVSVNDLRIVSTLDEIQVSGFKGLRGEPGPQGPQGERGEAGELTREEITNMVDDAIAEIGDASVELPAGIMVARTVTEDEYEITQERNIQTLMDDEVVIHSDVLFRDYDNDIASSNTDLVAFRIQNPNTGLASSIPTKANDIDTLHLSFVRLPIWHSHSAEVTNITVEPFTTDDDFDTIKISGTFTFALQSGDSIYGIDILVSASLSTDGTTSYTMPAYEGNPVMGARITRLSGTENIRISDIELKGVNGKSNVLMSYSSTLQLTEPLQKSENVLMTVDIPVVYDISDRGLHTDSLVIPFGGNISFAPNGSHFETNRTYINPNLTSSTIHTSTIIEIKDDKITFDVDNRYWINNQWIGINPEMISYSINIKDFKIVSILDAKGREGVHLGNLKANTDDIMEFLLDKMSDQEKAEMASYIRNKRLTIEEVDAS